MTLRAAAAALLLGAATLAVAKTTVCTITVNSADEREAFRRHLPADRFELVELAERGKPDWLGRACRQGIRCDVLVISGHFAGTAFYASTHGEHLPVEEMERVACGAACPGLFGQLREVYLFGCDTLKPEPVKSATPEIARSLLRAGHAPAQVAAAMRALSERHGESARTRMRRIFPDVPVVYGFSSLAPYGRVAGPMLERHFATHGIADVGSGRPSGKLLALFGPASMVAMAREAPSAEEAAWRAEACRYHDDRVTPAARIAFVHGILGGEAAALRMAFDRIERFVGSLDAAPRDAGVADALEALAGDAAARASYLGTTRETFDPALRVRMVALAHRLGWLDERGRRAELADLVGELLAAGRTGFPEVELVCGLNADGALDGELARFDIAKLARDPGNAAALACLGSGEARERVLRAVVSVDEAEVQVAQAYLRHRPAADEELEALVREVARMKPSPAQARAIETLARQHVSGKAAHAELARLFARTPSLAVQRAIAEAFLRAGARDEGLAATLRRHRLPSPAGRDVIDALLERLTPAGT